MRSRKLLALIFTLLAIAPALAGYMTLLGAGVGSIQPVVSWVSTTDPTFPSSSLTYSGPSLSTMFDSTGKLTYKPNNLALNTATLGTQSVTVQVGVNYLVSFASGGGSIALSGAGAGTVTSGAPVKVTASTSTLTLTVTGTVTNAVVAAVTYETTPRTGDQVITTSAAYYGPRIDYDPNTLAVKGLLIEEARTNILPRSSIGGVSDVASWTGAGGTLSGSQAGAPDGTASFALFTENTASSTHQVFITTPPPVASGLTMTGSVFLKAGTRRYVSVAVGAYDNGFGIVVDTQTWTLGNSVTVGTSTYSSSSITNVGSGIYRVSVTGVLNTTTAYLAVNSSNVSNPTSFAPTFVGTSSTFYAWGGQVEAASFATSYIPTAASSVTRAADVVQFTGAALTALNSTTYSAILEMADEVSAAAAYIIAPTVTNLPIFYNGSSVNVAPVYSYNGVGTINTSNITWSSANRLGFATSPSGRSLVANGGTVVSDTASPGALGASVSLFNGLSSTRPANGHIKSFAVYNQRLSDATLQAKSVVGASYAANDNANPFVPKFAANDNLPVHWRIAL